MFDNVASKIKVFSKVTLVIGIEISAISLIVAINVVADFPFAILMPPILFFSNWIGALCLYGFALLVEKAECSPVTHTIKPSAATDPPSSGTEKCGDWKCECGTINNQANNLCKRCFKKRPDSSTASKPTSEGLWICSCGTKNRELHDYCTSCFKSRPR